MARYTPVSSTADRSASFSCKSATPPHTAARPRQAAIISVDGQGGVVTMSNLLSEGRLALLTRKKDGITAWVQIKICDAETKKTPAFQEPTQLTVLPPLFSPVSRCVPSEEDGAVPRSAPLLERCERFVREIPRQSNDLKESKTFPTTRWRGGTPSGGGELYQQNEIYPIKWLGSPRFNRKNRFGAAALRIHTWYLHLHQSQSERKI